MKRPVVPLRAAEAVVAALGFTVATHATLPQHRHRARISTEVTLARCNPAIAGQRWAPLKHASIFDQAGDAPDTETLMLATHFSGLDPPASLALGARPLTRAGEAEVKVETYSDWNSSHRKGQVWQPIGGKLEWPHSAGLATRASLCLTAHTSCDGNGTERGGEAPCRLQVALCEDGSLTAQQRWSFRHITYDNPKRTPATETFGLQLVLSSTSVDGSVAMCAEATLLGPRQSAEGSSLNPVKGPDVAGGTAAELAKLLRVAKAQCYKINGNPDWTRDRCFVTLTKIRTASAPAIIRLAAEAGVALKSSPATAPIVPSHGGGQKISFGPERRCDRTTPWSKAPTVGAGATTTSFYYQHVWKAGGKSIARNLKFHAIRPLLGETREVPEWCHHCTIEAEVRRSSHDKDWNVERLCDQLIRARKNPVGSNQSYYFTFVRDPLEHLLSG